MHSFTVPLEAPAAPCRRVRAALAAVWLSLAGQGVQAEAPDIDLPAAAVAIAAALRQHVYDPKVLEGAPYQTTDQQVQALAVKAGGRDEFIKGFNTLWRNGPFSHVQLAVRRQGAEALAAHLDQLRVGAGATQLRWQGTVAVLVVDTMMGQDTIEFIERAYQALHERAATALVIDLRRNSGGAFAVRPLVGHVLREALDGGVFIGQAGATAGASAYDAAQTERLPPWEGWSIRRFWSDVQTQGRLRIRFTPLAPRYDGPVYVLTSRQTASAAELAVDALQASGRATVVGETTAGQMLSQRMFDLPQGLQLSLPIADYVARHTGRIEGKGVRPQVPVPAEQALQTALDLAAAGSR